MPLTKIEGEFAAILGDSTFFLTAFQFRNGQVSLRVSSPIVDERTVKATFTAARIDSIEEDEDERASWPMDLIGFDCYAEGPLWMFVLHCDTAEWSWVSEWPYLAAEAK